MLAGAAAVLASVPAAALAARSRGRATGGRDLPLPGRLRGGAVVQVGLALLAVEAVVAGLAGAQIFNENPATLLVWVVGWVGVGAVSALVGNLWEVVNPLVAAGRAVERVAGVRDAPASSYPSRLGMWPAVALALAWGWLELAWPEAEEPAVVAALLTVYIVAQLVGMAAFGVDVWLPRGELLTAISRTFGRFAPLELYVTRPTGPCPAAFDHPGGERAGCGACWRAAPRHGRGVRLRPFGAGVRREGVLGPGGAAFVLAVLATVVFDGFTATDPYAELTGWALDRAPWLAGHSTTLRTLLMAAVVVVFVTLYMLASAVVAVREPGGAPAVARRYAPSLIPIAAVYFVAHYLAYLVIVGQLAPAAILDPLDRGWVEPAGVWWRPAGGLVWALQVALIVSGHVVAVFEAHRIARETRRAPSARLSAIVHAPLTALMIAYTAAGLWVLAQAIRAP